MNIPDLAGISHDMRQRLLATVDHIKERSFAIITICNRADVALRMGKEDDREQLQAIADECRRQLQQVEDMEDSLKKPE